jgi:peptidoglycan/LPS O-acetylase OafA/YrhL
LVGSILVFARNTKFNNSIGRLSYPIYIVHFPVIYCFQEFQDKFSERFVNSELVWNGLQILVVILLSYILIFVTSPVEKIRARLRF